MNKDNYKYKGKKVYVQKEIEGTNIILVSFNQDGTGKFAINKK